MINTINDGTNSNETLENLENKTEKITDSTKEQVENLTTIKSKILGEINKAGFPDLKFLYSEESLEIIPEVLDELLELEKKNFADLLEKNIEEISFEDVNKDDNGLGYLFGLVEHLDGVKKSDVTETIIEDFEPKYIEFSNEVSYSKKLYDIYKNLIKSGNLDVEQTRIIQKVINSKERNGISLESEKQEKVKGINLKLSKLSQDFDSNIIKSKKEFSYTITDFEIIKNLPKETLEIAKNQAKEKGIEGYLFTADPTIYDDIMNYCSDSSVREYFSKAKNSFASSGELDNRGIILEILKLKSEKANILGYKNHAEFSLSSKMADSPEQIFELIGGISEKARKKALLEIEELKKYFGLNHLNAWDLAFYTNKLKEEKYDIDEKEIKKYLKYENVMSYLFDHAKNFYGLDLKEIDSKVYNEDVKVYEVYRNNKLISYYFTDLFFNPDKGGGAWANNLRGREIVGENELVPVVLNVCNFQKSENGDILLTRYDIETLFHEFGHAIHEMLSESKYSDLSGFNVETDFVELPSQINENWVKEKEGFSRLAKHYITGESINQELIDKIESSKNILSGNSVLRQNEFALTDMMLYSLANIPDSVEELDKIILDYVNNITVFPKGEEYKIYTAFSHIFGGGYSAGYYSYMWAELLEADVFEKIKEMGMFERETGEKFIQTILGQGTRKPAAELFIDFMGRDLDNTAFMKRKGLM